MAQAEKLSAMGQLLARLSHEINNPLRSSNHRTTALHGLRVEVASGSGTAGL